MSFRVFCDKCKKKLTRNMVSERLIVESGGFSAEVVISKKGVEDDGDLCYDCLFKMLNKRKYVRKQKVEPITTSDLQETGEGLNSEGLTLLKPTRKKKDKLLAETILHCSKCGMVTTTLVDGKPLCMLCRAEV